MISTGNDIVALNNIDQQRTNHPTFYSKFITEPERALFGQPDIPFESFVWLLWSAKEAAYKYLKRLDHELVFSPSKFIIQQIQVSNQFENGLLEIEQSVDKFYSGTIVYDAVTLYFRSIAGNDFINTIINDKPEFNIVYWGVKQIAESDYESQSAGVRAFILNKLNNLFPNHDLLIEKSHSGYPVLLIDNRRLDIPVSFSHHHRYVSYSFRISK